MLRLGQTLHQYSREQFIDLARRSHIKLADVNMNDAVAEEFEVRTHRELMAKHFLHDRDRQVALGILNSF